MGERPAFLLTLRGHGEGELEDRLMDFGFIRGHSGPDAGDGEYLDLKASYLDGFPAESAADLSFTTKQAFTADFGPKNGLRASFDDGGELAIAPRRKVRRKVDDLRLEIQATPLSAFRRKGESKLRDGTIGRIERTMEEEKRMGELRLHARRLVLVVDEAEAKLQRWKRELDGDGANPALTAGAVDQIVSEIRTATQEAEKLLASARRGKAVAPGVIEGAVDDVADVARTSAENLERWSREPFFCRGRFVVELKTKRDGSKCWRIGYINDGDTGFIGTAVFQKGVKNHGLGLESMAVPHAHSSAWQEIPWNGDYGEVRARPGEVLRIAIRGAGWATVPLPATGRVEISVSRFVRDIFSDESHDCYFGQRNVTEKREEKLDECPEKLRFFEGRNLVRP